MRMHPFHRTELLVGSEGFARLRGASVCVVGLGGVGSYAAEALARSGVGHLTLVDFDRVCLTNLNRQLHATRETVGEAKAELMAARVRAIDPKADVRGIVAFYGPDTEASILDRPYDAVLDAIDHMDTKLHLIETCVRRGLPIFAAMGAGGRMDPTRVRVSDLSETKVDPFAKIVRKNLRARGIETGVTCVWTDEPPNDLDEAVQDAFVCICPDKANSPQSCDRRFQVQGTVAWMPPIFGMTLAAAAAHHLLGRTLGGALPAPEPTAPRPSRASRLDALRPVSRADVGPHGNRPADG